MTRFITLILLVTLVTVTGCFDEKPSADKKQAAATERAMNEANRQIGMPSITNFQERRLAKQIFELRDQEKLVTYAYIASLEGKLIFIGKCIGFGLPYSVQYTNPERVAVNRHNAGVLALPQPDPNGLFMPSGLSATWLMMIDPKTGDARPVYVEPAIVVSPFPLH